MVKVLRKYNRWIMVIGGSLLMVMFLAPQAIQKLFGDPNKRVIATMNGAKVRANEIEPFEREYHALRDFPPLVRGLREASQGQWTDFKSFIQDSEHYFLLVKEAQDAGLVGGAETGRNFAQRLITPVEAARRAAVALKNPSATNAQISAKMREMFSTTDAFQKLSEDVAASISDTLARAGAVGRLNESEFATALARIDGILRMRQLYMQAPRISETRATMWARDHLDGANIEYAVIPADAVLAKVPEPSDAEVQAQFEKFKGVKKGEGDNGFGYWQPAKVRVEWIEVNKSTIARGIGEMVENAYKPDNQDPARGKIKEVVEAEWRNDNPSKPFEEFDKDRAAFTDIFKDRLAERVMRTAHEVAQLEAGAWDKAGLAIDAAAKDLAAKVTAQIRQEPDRWPLAIEMPMPVVGDSGPAKTAEQLKDLPGIGPSTTRRGAATIDFPQLAQSLKELGADPRQAIKLGSLVATQLPLIDDRRNQFYFRVLEARQPGASYDLTKEPSLRAEVATDARRVKGYEILTSELPERTLALISEGLDAVAKSYNEKPPETKPGDPPPPFTGFTAQTRKAKITPAGVVILGPEVQRAQQALQTYQQLSQAGFPPEFLKETLQQVIDAEKRVQELRTVIDSKEFRDRVLASAAKLNPRLDLAAQEAADRNVAAELPRSLSVVFARIESLDPLTSELMRSLGDDAASRLAREEFAGSATADGEDPFGPEAIRNRFNYKRLQEDQEKGAKKK